MIDDSGAMLEYKPPEICALLPKRYLRKFPMAHSRFYAPKENIRKGGTVANHETAGYSRRDFLRGSGFTAAGLAAASAVGGLVGCSTANADEVKEADGHIEVNPAKCSGCRTCMIVCSLYHHNAVAPTLANLRVTQATQNAFETSILTCKQCKTPDCYYACRDEGGRAMYIDEETGARVINQEKCIGCLKCIKACPQYPHAPIFFDEETKTCHKCDLCGGDPQCVKFCPMSLSLSEHCYPADEHPLTYTAKK